MKKLVFVLSTVLALAVTNVAVAQKTVVDVAAGNKDFSTLVTAVKAADLAGVLSGTPESGGWTVFAPTNEAFAKIDKNTLNSLLQPENKKALANILTYHVVPSKLMASDVVAALKQNNGKVEVKAVNGDVLTVMSKDGKIWIKDTKGNYSEIVATDVKGSNGVIHVIDTVVMPK
ncbi:fasciclin domain-containing protein [Winogradskyella aurantiaca]|uniref:fasciclin domain-containing protein n=1 Tax=Winogradskyella aurantiaca TaxID=2219558 RepID=UPI000E1C4ACD|nr:fasciclin domain-containing protein [Winogradskyella aurantiaca]